MRPALPSSSSGRRLRRAAGAALLLGALPLAAAPPRGRIEPGFGVTPGGLVWVVESAARRLVLRETGGSVLAAFPMAADEGYVLGATDAGARVTAPTPDGLRRLPSRTAGEPHVEARYVFRESDGSVRATARTTALRGAEPAFLGNEVWLVRREAGSFHLVRVGPDGEAAAGTIPEADVRRLAGRASSPRVFAGSPAAVLFPGARAEVLWTVATGFVVPDPLEACGEGRSRFLYRHPDGIVRGSIRTAPSADAPWDGAPLAVAELFDAEGRILRSAPLGPWVELFPLPDGGLLGLDGMQAVRFDDRFVEVSRAVLPLEEGSDAEAATRIVEQLRRLERLGARASGSDWAELMLLPGAPAGSHVALARRDPRGALGRLARVPDGDATASLAARAVANLVDLVDAEERPGLRQDLRGLVEEGGPVWLRRAAAFVLLAGPGEAPAWALPAVAEAVASGTAGDSFELPDEAYTIELAELVTAVDRARIDRIAAERPELAEALLAGSLDDAFSSSFEELRFHAPARLFARTLLDCAAGPPSVAGLLALTRVAEAAIEAAPSPAEVLFGRSDETKAAGTRGSLAGALLEARESPEPSLRAGALALGPLVGIPLDAGRFRSEVLRRPHLGALAALGLLADRSLPPRDWVGLFAELLAEARAASADPSACAVSSWPALQAEGDGNRDRYCNLFAIVRFAALDLGGEDDPAVVSRERIVLLAELARSASAPPELRAELKLARALRGTASEEEVAEILDERGLAFVHRRIALEKARPPAARLTSHLERELGSGRVPVAERSTWLDALARLDPAAGDRVAAEAWARGSVPLDGDDGEAGAFCRALDADRVRQSEPLRTALRKARTRPATSLEAAALLAKAGDAGSAGPLADALLERCPACVSASELAALFGPLGEEGRAELARVAEETLPFGVSPLEALFELDPTRAEALALDHLDAALERGCVPEQLLAAFLGNGLDPFPSLLSALEERGCDRTRLRPGEPVAVGLARPSGTESGAAARSALDAAPTGLCRRALALLLGMEEEELFPDRPEGR
ncbi:MAG: hypothetical protein ACYDBY_14845 [Thermoanaerobaculia bacterium]